MGHATTLFVATDEELARIFMAVRHPLDQPITKVGRNPLTGQVLGSASWDPGPKSSDAPAAASAEPISIRADDGTSVIAPAIATDSDETRRLEDAAPHRLRTLPHVVMPRITGLELEALGVLLVGEKKPPARIVEALDTDGFVDALPTEALEPLSKLPDDAIEETAGFWNQKLQMSGRRVDPAALVALRALAREALARGGHVLTHMP
jgi:hypothetical protein